MVDRDRPAGLEQVEALGPGPWPGQVHADAAALEHALALRRSCLRRLRSRRDYDTRSRTRSAPDEPKYRALDEAQIAMLHQAFTRLPEVPDD